MAKSAQRTATILDNPFDRFVLAPGIVGWVYRYRNQETLAFDWHTSSTLELGVQLAGTWSREGAWAGAEHFDAGEVVTIGRGEHHAYRFGATAGTEGVQVGFGIYPSEIEGLQSVRGDLSLAPPTDAARLRLLTYARDLYQQRMRGEAPDPSVGAAVLELVRSHAIESAADGIARARHELDTTFHQPLYVRHIAEIAGMDPTRFARRFRARYGVTPTSYRLEQRVNAAIRLAWSEPQRSLRQIAEDVGFEDVSYLHRACRRKRGLTPAELGRRGRRGLRAIIR